MQSKILKKFKKGDIVLDVPNGRLVEVVYELDSRTIKGGSWYDVKSSGPFDRQKEDPNSFIGTTPGGVYGMPEECLVFPTELAMVLYGSDAV